MESQEDDEFEQPTVDFAKYKWLLERQTSNNETEAPTVQIAVAPDAPARQVGQK